MVPERAKLLGKLLDELSRDPEGYIPEEAWLQTHKAFALPYIELVVVRRDEYGNLQFVLTHRHDEHWSGWHVPGGLWRTRHTLEEGIETLTERELGPTVRLTLLAQGPWDKWHDHAYGNVISHIVVCSATGIEESDTVKWFTTLPDGLIDEGRHYAKYIEYGISEASKFL